MHSTGQINHALFKWLKFSVCSFIWMWGHNENSIFGCGTHLYTTVKYIMNVFMQDFNTHKLWTYVRMCVCEYAQQRAGSARRIQTEISKACTLRRRRRCCFCCWFFLQVSGICWSRRRRCRCCGLRCCFMYASYVCCGAFALWSCWAP